MKKKLLKRDRLEEGSDIIEVDGHGRVVGAVEDDGERKKIRERVGLTYEELCKVVKAGLVAEVIITNAEGKEVNRVPANSTRAKFVQPAMDLLGGKKTEVGAQKCPQINIHLPTGFSFK